MILYLGNLPPSVSEGRLLKVLGLTSLSPSRLRIVKKPLQGGRVARYGLLQLQEGRDARRLLKGRRPVVVDGIAIEIREFHRRAAANERRALDWRQRAWPHPERRKAERRQPEARQPEFGLSQLPEPSAYEVSYSSEPR
ncbi:MAG TPA: RNA-binding protein [Thiotrichales bacterium]|nr:RNA-binding protein [Thiotrichales bacterium]